MLPHFVNLEDVHDIAEAFATALDAKSLCMCGHSERVAELSRLLATGMGLPTAEQTRIHIGAHLHDVGKIGIPDSILNKSGRLTEEEMAVMRQHPVIGSRIVSKVKILQSIVDIVRHHHERFDGTGYPDGLRGDEISLGARIVSVADAFDAMTTARTYRSAMGTDEAMEETRRCKASQFDPDVVEVFLALIDSRRSLGWEYTT
ncbi:MAG: HD-GYP domain-containing protein [Negativicutes bacterium]|nr:HD-GYP domain-containing protein [Negativicutes bacterium]